MATNFTSSPQRHIDPPEIADDGKRSPRSSDTIYRRLSRLDLGIAPDPCSMPNSPSSEVSNETAGNGRLRKRTWFVVLDSSGPLADFPTWEDAYRYVTINDVAACIIRVEGPPEPTGGGG